MGSGVPATRTGLSMEVSEQVISDLKGEAAMLYREYRRLKKAGPSVAQEEGALERLEGIRQRYTEIEAELDGMENHSSDEIEHLSNFDVPPYRAHRPVVASPHDGVLEHIFTRLSPRMLISCVALLFLTSVGALVFTKNIGFFVVPSSSMEPTLVPQDKLLTLYKSEYSRGDVVVLIDPKDPESYLVKRIVAMQNDDVYVHNGQMIVNTKPILEPYIKESMKYEFGPYKVPAGHVFVLGDNRNESDDGHEWGFGIPLDTVIGQVKYIYSPRERKGALPDVHENFSVAGS